MVVGQRGMEEKRKEARERKRKETRKRFWLNQKMLHTCEHEAHSNRKWRIFAKRRGATKVYVRAILNVGHLARRRRREHHCHSYRYEKRLGHGSIRTCGRFRPVCWRGSVHNYWGTFKPPPPPHPPVPQNRADATCSHFYIPDVFTCRTNALHLFRKALFVFIPRFQNTAALAASLAFAAGVMIYVSMVESK